MPNNKESFISAAEAKSLFSDLQSFPALLLAVSGGPDSTALLWLAARWRDALKSPPKLIAITVDHGLRKESRAEAAGVARLARKLKVAHRTLRWRGKKPASGLQQAARAARYRLLSDAAREAGASHILTAHTLDDQAETVLIRMSRGSGVTGLGAMARMSSVPGNEESKLVRPLLDIPKSRLIDTLRAAKVPFADDPSNRDPRFTRARLRGLLPQLAQEGLDARRLALLARRLKRADAAIEVVVDQAMDFLAVDAPAPHAMAFEAGGFFILPAEITLRMLGRAVTQVGDEGPVELAKLEALKAALDAALKAGKGRFRRSLAGALVTLAMPQITVERAPPRRGKSLGAKSLTTGRRGRAKRVKSR
ncbi:MAG: tRNA lysidine(34) synthetase TilS [Rhizobiales bacterium]|nr:tRNA lysidine(34) synthetase TilS [Hyphomicrobiales bacterium]